MIGKSGVIGEEVNRLLMYLIFTSRKREHPLHIISHWVVVALVNLLAGEGW
jgi:hypothetical protein